MDTFLIISNSNITSKKKRIWGDGSWIPTSEREALEWFMIAKMMGWKAEIISAKEKKWKPDPEIRYKWIVLACDPDTLHPFLIETVLDLIAEVPSLLILRKGRKNASWHSKLGLTFSEQSVTGKELSISFEDIVRIPLINPIQAHSLESWDGQSFLINLTESPISVQIKLGKSHIVGMGFNPIEKIDEHPEIFPLVKKILTLQNPNTVAWIDWTGTMALRMDDPGSSELIHHEIYHDTTKLTDNQWLEIAEVLDRFNAKLSIAYVNGWVDDGNSIKGELKVNGNLVNRLPGKVYPSQEVLYISKNNIKYDYVSEYQSIRKFITQEKVQVETHGFTHIYPDLYKWTQSANSYQGINWFREFGPEAMKFIKCLSPENHPLQRASKALAKYWNDKPWIMVFPGETFTLEAQEDTLDLGWKMISSYYQAIKIGNRFCWTQLVESPYLDQHNPHWAIKECPVVGYFHDFDLSKNGVSWFENCLKHWRNFGFHHFIDLRTLFVGYNFNIHVEDCPGKTILHLNNAYYKPDGYHFRIKISMGNYERMDALKIALPSKIADIPNQNNQNILSFILNEEELN